MSEINIINANFTNGRETVTRKIFQYDYGQKLKIKGINLPFIFQAHISNQKQNGTAKKVIGEDNQINIPDEYFISGQDIYIFIVLHQGLEDGETRYLIKIPVIKRSKSSDQQPTPIQQDVIENAISILNKMIETTSGYTPIRGVDYWTEEDQNEIKTYIINQMPTKISDLQNDANYIDASGAPVQSVNNQTGDVVITAQSLGALTQHQDISGKADKSELSAVATSGSYNDLTNKPTIPSNVSDLTNDENYQTDADVSAAIADAISQITGFDFEIVQQLPASGEKGIIYLIAHSHDVNDGYDEYIWVIDKFERLGNLDIDLSGYLQTSNIISNAEIDQMFPT